MPSQVPTTIGEILAELATCFKQLGVRWYLFGGQAAIFHGVARLTADVDVTVELGSHSTDELIAALSTHGFELRTSKPSEFVTRTQVVPVVHTETRIPVDMVLAGPGLEERFLDRAEIHVVEGASIPVASAEDIITMKMLSYAK